MPRIYQVQSDKDNANVRDLFWEYLQWLELRVNEEFGDSIDFKSVFEQDMLELEKFSPPCGRLLLAEYEGQVAGLACLRKIREDIVEIRRMYVRPEFRGKRIGRTLLDSLIIESRAIGYVSMRLYSGRFMTEAHSLYRSAGFQEIDPYPECEVPVDFHPNLVFMEKKL